MWNTKFKIYQIPILKTICILGITLHIFIQHFLCTFKDTYKVYENGGYNEEITHLPVSHNFSVISRIF